jgi:hypothetical protein
MESLVAAAPFILPLYPQTPSLSSHARKSRNLYLTRVPEILTNCGPRLYFRPRQPCKVARLTPKIPATSRVVKSFSR